MSKQSKGWRIGAIGGGAALLAFVALYLAGVIGPAPQPSVEPGAGARDSAALQPGVPAAPQPGADATPQQNSPQSAPEQGGIAAPSGTAPPAPQIDIFRLQPDGEALIAGQGAAGWSVQILLDGVVQTTADPGSDGRFAIFLTLPQAAGPRLLSLRMVHADGRPQIDGAQQVVVAPASMASGGASSVSADLSKRLAPPDAAANTPGTEMADASGPLIAQDSADNGAAADGPPPEAPEAPEDTAGASTAPPQMVLMTDAQGARVLQSPAPDAVPRGMSNVALDTISYSDNGDVQLAGRAAGQGVVRVYLDNRPIATSRIAADGTWRSALPQVDTGIYTLRIDEVTSSGTVTSRVETPFKREDRALLAELQDAGTSLPGTALPGASTAGPQSDAPAIRVITVQAGNTLWAISRETYGEGMLYVRVFEANAERIRNPDLIYPGQVFTLPD